MEHQGIRQAVDKHMSHSARSDRVVRGGSWHAGPDLLCSANRDWNYANILVTYRGFRLGRTLTL